MNRRIVFFDGVCNLCNASVREIIRCDPEGKFFFASLQSDFAKSFFAAHNYIPATDSVIYWDGKTFSDHSSAVIRIAGQTRFPIKLFALLRILPKSMRDGLYHWVERKRYRWFGKRDSCMVPDPAIQRRFLG